MIEHKIFAYGSEGQKQTVVLRDLVLRKPLGMVFTKEQLAAENNQLHIGQFVNGQLTACLVMKPIDENIVKMRQVAVHPDHQGKGYGKILIQFTENEMLQRGFSIIELHARDSAVPFYLKRQYKIEGEPFDEIGITHFKMVKSLV